VAKGEEEEEHPFQKAYYSYKVQSNEVKNKNNINRHEIQGGANDDLIFPVSVK